MKYRNLGRSGLKVSVIGLGGNNFGSKTDVETSIEIIHHAIDKGINFIDTSDWYSSRGNSEIAIGKALKEKRHNVVIATKFGFDMSDNPNDQGCSRYHIINAVDASLLRLQTDYIDLYQLHKPDPATPIEETLGTLTELIKSGKIRYIGCANFSAWQLSHAMWVSKEHNYEPFVTAQSGYNLLDRTIEEELLPCCLKHQVGVIPWGPLAGGFLTGKYKRNQAPSSDFRLANPPVIQKNVLTDHNFDTLEKLEKFATEQSHSVGELAIAWLLAQKGISTVITGATRKEQIDQNVKSAEWEITSDELSSLELAPSVVTGRIATSVKDQ